MDSPKQGKNLRSELSSSDLKLELQLHNHASFLNLWSILKQETNFLFLMKRDKKFNISNLYHCKPCVPTNNIHFTDSKGNYNTCFALRYSW